MQKNTIPRIEIDDPFIESLNVETAARMAQLAVLEGIYLVDAKVNRDPLSMFPEAISLEHKCSTNYLPSKNDKNLFFILCNFQVAAFSDKATPKVFMKIEASFCTSYRKTPDFRRFTDIVRRVSQSPADDLEVSDLLEVSELVEYENYLFTINPISNAWPYWREFVQSMSTRMGFPALTVPLLEIVPKKPAAKEEKRQPAKRKPTQRKKLSA